MAGFPLPLSEKRGRRGNHEPYTNAEMKQRRNEREIVLDLLLAQHQKGAFMNVLVRETLDRFSDLEPRQRAFIKRLAEGVVERRLELDAVLDRYSKKPMSAQKPKARIILRMGLYQLLYMDSVPASAACNESVRLAKRVGLSAVSGYINGLLRNIARDLENGRLTAEQESLSVRYSMPQWIIDLWDEQLGREQTEQLLPALLAERPVCIRIMPAVTGEERDRLITDMTAAGAELTPGRWIRDCYYMKRSGRLTDLPGYRKGKWTVQDESSMFAVTAAGLTGDEFLMDVCAAPGGKATHAASLLPAGHVEAFDLTEQKVERIRENAARLRLTNLTAQKRDALSEDSARREQADVLLCDLPCSGLGIIGRKQDIKYRVTYQDLPDLADLQRRILAASLPCLKPGGVLIYSTCTIDRLENEENLLYIKEELGMIPEDISGLLPAGVPGIRHNAIQLLPHIHGTDGFFVARFRKPFAQ